MARIVVMKIPEQEIPEPTLLSHISAEKRQKLTRFIHQADANRSLYGELLVRYMASQQLGVSSEDLVITANPHGKPYIEGRMEFQYNLSHSGCWVAMIYGDIPVGIDVEKHRGIDTDSLARICLTPNEHLALNQYIGEDRLRYFYQLWTSKESYIKAIGKGMSIPLDSFEVRYEGVRTYVADQANDGSSYHLKTYELEPGYTLSACSASNDLPDQMMWLDYQELAQFFQRGDNPSRTHDSAERRNSSGD